MNREFRFWESDHGDTEEESNDSDGDEMEDRSSGFRRNNRNRRRKSEPKQQMNSISQEIQFGLNRIRTENPETCDITLIAGEFRILAHKLVLCSCSSYFNAMFSGGFAENSSKEIVLNGLDNEMLIILIDFMYTGKLEYKAENVQRIYIMARFLQNDSAQEICINHLKSNISLKNCLQLLQWAGVNSVQDIIVILIKFVSKNFCELYMKTDFLLIEVEEFKKLLSEKLITQISANTLFAIILRWIEKDLSVRIKHLDGLLDKIKAPRVASSLIETAIEKNYIKKYVAEKWIAKYAPIDTSDLTNWDFLVFKRTGNLAEQAKLHKANIEASAEIANFKDDVANCSYVNYGSTIYCLGGCLAKRRVTNESMVYNIYKNKWTKFIKLLMPRGYHRSCILNGSLYTLGGSDGFKAFNSVESIDLISGQQTVLPNMLYARESMGVTCSKNAIYVFGGKNRGMCEYISCELYDPRIGVWQSLDNFPKLAGICSAATVNDSIYCVNGRCEDNCGLNRFDIVANKWTSIYTHYFRYPDEVFDLNNNLYGLFKDHLAQYLSENGKWKMICQFGYHSDHLTALPILIGPNDLNNIPNNNNDNDLNVAF